MAQVVVTRTYVTGNSLTASNYNDDRTEIIAGINSINNSQVASNAAIAESKFSFDTSAGHDHDGTDSKKVLATSLGITGLTASQFLRVNSGGTAVESAVVQTTVLGVSGLSAGQVLKVNSGGTAVEGGGAGRAFTWGIRDTVSVADEQGMKYIVPQGFTCNKLWYKLDSGTATIRIQRDTTNVVSSASVTSSVGSTTSFDSATLTAGEVLTLDVTVVSSASGLFVVLECTQT